MSLSDYLRYMRAVKGGLTPWEIAEGSGVPARDVHLMEVKHRRMGTDGEVLAKLAAFFGVPVDEFTNRREAYRKRLTYFLQECTQDSSPVVLKMESGEEIEGTIDWYSREAIALNPLPGDGTENHLCVVQRAWVADWRRAGSPQWEVASAEC